jgi:hypothetical protein
MKLNESTDTLDKEVKSLSVILYSMIIGIIVFGLVSLIVNRLNGPYIIEKEVKNILLLIGILLSPTLIEIARYIYQKKIKSLSESDMDPLQRLDKYKSILLFFLAIVEFPGIYGAICFLLGGEYLSFLFVAMSVIQMLLKMPTKTKLASIMAVA